MVLNVIPLYRMEFSDIKLILNGIQLYLMKFNIIYELNFLYYVMEFNFVWDSMILNRIEFCILQFNYLECTFMQLHGIQMHVLQFQIPLKHIIHCYLNH